jgi:hypothetical protein
MNNTAGIIFTHLSTAGRAVKQQMRKTTSLNSILKGGNYFVLMRHIFQRLWAIPLYPGSTCRGSINSCHGACSSLTVVTDNRKTKVVDFPSSALRWQCCAKPCRASTNSTRTLCEGFAPKCRPYMPHESTTVAIIVETVLINQTTYLKQK